MKKTILTSLLSILVAGTAFAASMTVVTTNTQPISTNSNSVQFPGYVINGLPYTVKLSHTIGNSTFPKLVTSLNEALYKVSVSKSGAWTNPIFYGANIDWTSNEGCNFQFRLHDNQLQIAYVPIGLVRCNVGGNMISLNTYS